MRGRGGPLATCTKRDHMGGGRGAVAAEVGSDQSFEGPSSIGKRKTVTTTTTTPSLRNIDVPRRGPSLRQRHRASETLEHVLGFALDDSDQASSSGGSIDDDDGNGDDAGLSPHPRDSTPPTMGPRDNQQESASFLPSGNLQRRGTSRTLGLVTRLVKRRNLVVALCVTAFVSAQLWIWGPDLVGKERVNEWKSSLDAWRPTGQAPPHRVYPPPLPPTPQAGTPTEHAPAHGLTSLPPGYEDPPGESEDNLSITPASFPARLANAFDAHKLSELYQTGDPHQGIIPSPFFGILDRGIPNVPPPRPIAAPASPPGRYTPRSGWSATLNGSKTSYRDAFQPELQPVEADWRTAPYNSWRPPLAEFALKKRPSLPKIQFAFTDPSRHSGGSLDAARDKVVQQRQKLVRNAFLHSWEGYKKLAWGHDELRPVSEKAQDNFNGWGATIVDALDTLLVMDLPVEYDYARQHVRDIDFHLIGGGRSAYGSADGRIPVFETSIRYLGGFLSAYDLSGDTLMRDRAEELAQLILPAFDTPTGLAVGRIRFGQGGRMASTGGVILAEAASMLLEMTRLWQVTGNRTYFDRVQRTTDWLDRNMTGTPDRLGSLWSTSIFPERGTMYGWYTWGGQADSAFEYLIKEHQLLAGQLDQYGRMFGQVLDSARQWLLRPISTVPNAPLLVLGQSNGKSFQPKLEHLTCFAGGSMGLSAKLLPNRDRDLAHAKRFTETCWWTYNATLTGIGPEDIVFYKEKDDDRFSTTIDKDGTSRRGAARGQPIVGVRRVNSDYRNRPETIESIFYMWRITGDPVWQERGWQMFCSWVTHSMTTVGFSSLSNVLTVPAPQSDSMESFTFAETFKYYYLLFSPPEVISLDDYVFTTEAHPLLAPQKGVWARAGSGPRKMWDEKASHTPKDKSAYSGGELGDVGGLTSAQKTFVYEAWQADLAREANKLKAQEAEAKAKEKSLLNTALLAREAFMRKVIDPTRR